MTALLGERLPVGTDAAATRFLRTVAPLLAEQELCALTGLLCAKWPCERLVGFLSSTSPEILNLAAACLGLTGTMIHCEYLVPFLGHSNREIARSTEDSLWRIWMQGGSRIGNEDLVEALECIEAGAYCAADQHLAVLTAAEPTFAEGHHQHAIVLTFLERPDEAADAYRMALKTNPHHFAAAAGLGHVHTMRADVCGALRHYRRALRIHPGLDEIREAVEAIEAAMQRRRPAAG